MKYIAILSLLLATVCPTVSFAQSSPGFTNGPPSVSAQRLNEAFESKMDYPGTNITCGLVFSAGTVCGNPTGSPVVPSATSSPVLGSGGIQGTITLNPGSGAPGSLANGELWTTSAGLFAQINGSTVGPFSSISSASFAATEPITVSFPANVVTYAFDYSHAGTFTNLQTFNAGIISNAISVNITSGGCTESPGIRAPFYICNDNNGINAAGYALGWQVWIGNNPVGSIAANNAVASFVYLDNTNGRQATWAANYICNQLPVSLGGSVVQNHCQENDVLQSQATTTPLSAINNQGPITHAYEAVCSQNTSGSPQPCHVAYWLWAAGDYANNSASQTQPFDFGFAATRTQYAGFDCELQSGDTGTYFKQGCVWDQSNSVTSYQVTGTHTSIIDVSAATFTNFVNAGSKNVLFAGSGGVNVAGLFTAAGGAKVTGNAGNLGLTAALAVNAASGNSGVELETGGVTRGYLAVTASLMNLYTNAALPLHIGANNADAILISGTNVIQVPTVTTGTPAASLCIDSSNNIIKKTTTGPCV